MNHFSRFLRTVLPGCAALIAGAALVSGSPAEAATPSFTLTPPSATPQTRHIHDALVPIGIAPTAPNSTDAYKPMGSFSTLLGSTGTSPSGFRLVQATGSVTVTLASTTYEITEGIPTVTLTITRSGDTSGTTTVRYNTTNGTATASVGAATNDYKGVTPGTIPTVDFAAGETSVNLSFTVYDDNVAESDETFDVSLISATSNPNVQTSIGTNNKATVTIKDNEPVVTFFPTTVLASEEDGLAFLTLTRSGSTTSPTKVSYTFNSGGTATAGKDYTAQNGTVTFQAGSATAQIPVTILEDTLDEPSELFSVSLAVPPGDTSFTVGANATAEVTITDNDSTSVGIEMSTYEVDEAAGDAVLTVVRSGDISQAITVDYRTSNDTNRADAARAGSDYTNTSGTLQFAAGAATSTIRIPIINSAAPENREDFQVTLSNPRFVNPPPTSEVAINATQPNASATVYIKDDDPAINFASATYTVDEGVGSATISVIRSGSTTGVATVAYATSNNVFTPTNRAAVAGQDYTAQSGTLTFADGEETKTINIPILNDANKERDERFSVTLSGAVGATVGPTNPTVVTITDNDAEPTITIDDASPINEGDAGTSDMVFNVTLNNPSGQTVTVDYATADGSATDGLDDTGATSTTEDNDYTATSGTLTFTPIAATGLTPRTLTVRIPVVGDTRFEGDATQTPRSEAFIVALSNPNAASILRKTAVGTILDDDAAPDSKFNFNPATLSVAENVQSGRVNLTITRTGDISTNASVTLTTTDGTATASSDYTAVSTVLSFPANVASQTVPVSIFDDSVNEANETFTATLSNPQGFSSLGTTPKATVTISNDDVAPLLTVAPASVTEGNSGTANLVFQATIDAPSEQTITVQYATVDGTATVANNDYVAKSGTLTFQPGDTSKTITVVVNGDTNIESTETLSLALTNAQNVRLNAASATGTIVNDDTPPTTSNIAFASTNYSVTEGTPSVTLTVRRTTGTDRAATIDYSTNDGTATEGSDYTAVSGTLTFAVGETTATITVPITDDTLQELSSPETFTVTLSNPSGNAVLPSQPTATVTITDNDGTPTLSVTNTGVSEGDSGTTALDFTVSLSPQSQSAVTVQIATTTEGTATSSGSKADFSQRTATLTFAPGVATQTFTVNVRGDIIVEPDETVKVKLSNAQGAPIASNGATATGTIFNDDEPGGGGTISFLAVSYAANENAVNTGENPVNSVTITLGRTGNVDTINQQSATVRFVTGSGSATPNKDYRPVNRTVKFAPGETTASILVPLVNDDIFEVDETVSLLISNPSDNAILGSITKATLTITDDDPQSSVPRVDSLTPSTPTGSPFTVKATYSSDMGVNDLDPVLIQIGGNANGNGLRALYSPKTNLLSLDPSTGKSAKPGSKVLLTNQFGTLDASKTKVQRSGNSITVTWTFRLTSTKALPIFVGATGSSGQSIFVRKGTWRPASTATRSSNDS